LVTDSHSILTKWRNYFSHLFNVHGVSVVRQTEIHTAEPLVSELSAFQVEMASEKLKRHKSPDSDQIPPAGCRTIRSEIHKLINPIWNKEELPEEWRQPIIVPTCKKVHKTDGRSMELYRFYQLLATFYPTFCCKVHSISRRNYWGSSEWISTQQVNYSSYNYILITNLMH